MDARPRPKRLGFFTRLLDQAGPAERYRLATEQIVHAEEAGFDSPSIISMPMRAVFRRRWCSLRRSRRERRGFGSAPAS